MLRLVAGLVLGAVLVLAPRGWAAEAGRSGGAPDPTQATIRDATDARVGTYLGMKDFILVS
jgi:hypothetical protein